MDQPHYELRATSDRLQFEFISISPKRRIIKRVEYTYIEEFNFWNLGFGDYNPDTGQLDDQIVSDNGDTRKVLATIAFSLREFIALNQDATVFFTGSTDQRTHVYGWIISRYWADISDGFVVEGVMEDGNTVLFTPYQSYIGFLIRKK